VISSFPDCDVRGIDLVFILDSTVSIRSLYQRLRELTLHITSLLDIGVDQSLVGVIRFSCSSQLMFNLHTHTSNDTLFQALETLPYSYRRGPTNIDDALSLLLESAQDGTMGLREGHPHVAIFVTDGSSSDIKETMSQASILHNTSIYNFYAAGFGAANSTELNVIASTPSLVFYTNQIDRVAIQLLEEKITHQLCQCKYIPNVLANNIPNVPNSVPINST